MNGGFHRDGLYEGLLEYALYNIRGSEQQHYSRRAEKLRVPDAQLTITTTDRPVVDPYRNTDRHWAKARLVKYNSAIISTHGKQVFLYWKLEIRAKLPRGRGAFPAIWLLWHDFHTDRRMDTAQGRGCPVAVSWTLLSQLVCLWRCVRLRVRLVGRPSVLAADFADDFGASGINATPEQLEQLEQLLDGQVNKTVLYADADPKESKRWRVMAVGMNRHMYLQINLATGGNWAGDAGDYLGADGTSFVANCVHYSQTEEQKAADAAYYSHLLKMAGVRDLTVVQEAGR